MKFRESAIAHKYLGGLEGLEIGGAAHNPFGLNTKNCDDPVKVEGYKGEQIELCGEVLPVDIPIKDGANLDMIASKSVDFVINSHVIEHILRPDKALLEWSRVARKYIFLIIPHKERTFDKDRPETEPEEIYLREDLAEYPDAHHNVWTPNSFLNFFYHHSLLKKEMEVVYVNETDDKVGNGFTVILKIK